MEVHHPHHPTHKKKWNEYFLEFFMLFAAVTLGFFAENIRESISNKEKEKIIIASLKEDIIKDTVQLHYLINEYPKKIEYWNDSLHSIFDRKEIKNNEAVIIQAIVNSCIWEYYSASEVALSLTSNSESMNLIESRKLKKQMLDYHKNEKYYEEYLKFIVNTFQQTDTSILSVCELKNFRQVLAKASLSDLYITSENIPKNIVFRTYDKPVFNTLLRNIDHSDLKISDLKTIYSMLMENEKEILKIITDEYKNE